MFRLRIRALGVVVLLALGLGPGRVRADEISKLGDQLSASADFRVRTQAALALGSSRDKRAHPPLCRALNDAAPTVRAAAAAALGKLNKGGEDCLRTRLQSESAENVRKVLEKALARMAPPDPAAVARPITETTRFYVAVEVVDATSRGGRSVAELVRRAMVDTTKDSVTVVLAPDGESQAAAKKALQGKKSVRGFLLSTKVKAPEYSGDTLTVRLEVAIFMYPEKTLKGTVTRTLSMKGLTGKDRTAEDELIRNGARRALEVFLESAEKIQ